MYTSVAGFECGEYLGSELDRERVTVEQEQLVQAHSAMVRRIITVYERHPDRVRHLVHDVWSAVWEAKAAAKNDIARIAQNTCLTRVASGFVKRREPCCDGVAAPVPFQEETGAPATQFALLLEAVRNMPDNLKVVASLYLEDLSVKEIALALGIGEDSVSARLRRIKSAIRFSLDDGSVTALPSVDPGIGLWQTEAEPHTEVPISDLRRLKRRALALDTVSLLKHLIQRTRNEFFIAKCLSIGGACGATALLSFGRLSARTFVFVFVLLVISACGAVLASSKRHQVQEFSDTLKSMTMDL